MTIVGDMANEVLKTELLWLFEETELTTVEAARLMDVQKGQVQNFRTARRKGQWEPIELTEARKAELRRMAADVIAKRIQQPTRHIDESVRAEVVYLVDRGLTQRAAAGLLACGRTATAKVVKDVAAGTFKPPAIPLTRRLELDAMIAKHTEGTTTVVAEEPTEPEQPEQSLLPLDEPTPNVPATLPDSELAEEGMFVGRGELAEILAGTRQLGTELADKSTEIVRLHGQVALLTAESARQLNDAEDTNDRLVTERDAQQARADTLELQVAYLLKEKYKL